MSVEVIKIKSVYLSRFNNEEYTKFLSGVVGLLEKATLEKLHIEQELFDSFKENVSLLTDVSRRSTTSHETKELNELDKKRNELIVYLMSFFRMERKVPIETRKKAAGDLYEVAKPYQKMQQLPNRQKTQAVEGFLLDMGKETNVSYLKTLGLTSVISQLEAVNRKYSELTEGRAESQMANKVVGANSVRKKTDKQYAEIVMWAFSMSIITPSEESKKFVLMLNKLIDDTSHIYKQRIGLRNASSSQSTEMKEILS